MKSSPGKKKGEFEQWRDDWTDQIYNDSKYYSWSQRAILAYMARKYLNRQTLTMWPEIDTLAEELGASVNTIQGATKKATARGHLETHQRREKGHRNYHNIYIPLLKGERVSVWAGTGISLEGNGYHPGDTDSLKDSVNKNCTPCFLKDSAQEGWPGNGVPGQTSKPSNAGDLGMSSDNPLPSKGKSPEVPRKVRWSGGLKERPRAWGLEASSPEEFERSLPRLVKQEKSDA